VRTDPGPCPICGSAHTACTSDSGPIVVTQLPARDALTVDLSQRALPVPSLETVAAPVTEADAGRSASLGDGTDARPFSTNTYRGRHKVRRP
jgi:hypothetical protein